jgi:putative phosphoesterase
MLIGILSDTHGDADIAHVAVRALLDRGAEYLVHCGDVGSTDVLDALAGHPAMFVFGNTDFDTQVLTKYAGIIGIACGNTYGKLAFAGKTAVVTHGDDSRLVKQVIADQLVDYLFLGHTHQKLDRREGKVRIINPGALHRAAVKTVAILDTVKDELAFITVG